MGINKIRKILSDKNPYQQFQSWYDEYFSFVYLFLVGYFEKRNIPVRDSEIEDLVQNTFLALLERKTKAPIIYPMAYLKQTAISQARICIDKKIKTNLREKKQRLSPQPISTTPSNQLEKQESEQQVWFIINNILNQIESKLVFQRVVKGYSYKEIAAQEDMPQEHQLHSIYHRAKIKLHRYLKDIGYNLPADAKKAGTTNKEI
ncbi:MAG: RNA polymerase sigma factor [Saprospiraceae bacterium]